MKIPHGRATVIGEYPSAGGKKAASHSWIAGGKALKGALESSVRKPALGADSQLFASRRLGFFKLLPN